MKVSTSVRPGGAGMLAYNLCKVQQHEVGEGQDINVTMVSNVLIRLILGSMLKAIQNQTQMARILPITTANFHGSLYLASHYNMHLNE